MTTLPCSRPPVAFRPEQPWFVLSAARHYSLISSHHPAISHFYSFEVDTSEALTLAIPDACVDIVFDCDAEGPKARVCGTTLTARGVELIHRHRYFGVRFAPGVIPDFLDLVAEDLTDSEISFMDAVPDARLALEEIVQNQRFSQQVALFNQHFFPRLSRRGSTVTPQVIHAICQQKGNIRIDELETLTGYTCRTIQRQFRQDTGMSPKAFSRIMRCQSALNTLHQPGDIAFTDLAFDLGFSDQSHFLREFKKLVSTTPLDYQKRLSPETYQARVRHHQANRH